MHTNQTYNSLTIENPELPFPPEMQEVVKTYPWEEAIWNSIGFPAFNSAFCLTGKQLYFEGGENGKINLKKSDYTGQAIISGIVTPDDSDVVFFLVFELSFCGGTLSAAELKEYKTEPYEAYKAGLKKFEGDLIKNTKLQKSKWFRFLYKPYYYLVSVPATIIVGLIQIVVGCFLWVVDKLLPYKL